ncbi:MAG: APC family permease [Armatimonadota bacterium]|nr:APC family permease [Armatimonadota bacterium]MCX7777716.1 APC family permease [Armatimonadota bacterium]MDW8025869.1 APC family permease [Armatimonadota bacterium]
MSGHETKVKLRREVSVWGSFCWGYADVGADVYVALGLVMAAAQGATPLAFAIAGTVYIFVGLAYTEMASAYPVAGGGQYFALRGLGDVWSLICGAGLLLAYTVDVALFATASAGYINFFFPAVREFAIDIGPFKDVNLIWLAETLFLILLLAVLNIKGIRESSLFNETLGALDLILETTVIVIGFAFAWRPDYFLHQWETQFPTTENLAYAITIAVISYVGLESISQAAQETIRPTTVIPRSSLALIVLVLMFALAFPTVSLGIVDWQTIAKREGDPIAHLASHLPFIGFLAGPAAAILGATILLISANTGVMGASRLAYSMSETNLMGAWLSHVHPKFRTPVRTIVIFSGIAALQALWAFFSGRRAMDTLVDIYAFGAMLAYFVSCLSLIALRIKEPHTPRAFKAPLNVRLGNHEIPVIGVLGALGTFAMLVTIMWTHHSARIFGPIWVAIWFAVYIWHRRRNGLPIFRSTKCNWDEEQLKILSDTGEWELYERLRIELERRSKRS